MDLRAGQNGFPNLGRTLSFGGADCTVVPGQTDISHYGGPVDGGANGGASG